MLIYSGVLFTRPLQDQRGLTRQDFLFCFSSQVCFSHGEAGFILYFCFLCLPETQEGKPAVSLSCSHISPEEMFGVHRASVGASVE